MRFSLVLFLLGSAATALAGGVTRRSLLPFSKNPAFQTFTFTEGPLPSVSMIQFAGGKFYLSRNCLKASGFSCEAYTNFLARKSVSFEADEHGYSISPATTLCTKALSGTYVVGTRAGIPGPEEEGFCLFSDRSYLSSAAVFKISELPAEPAHP